MNGVLAVMSVNVKRSAGRKWYVILTIGMMLGAVVAAVLMSSKMDGRGTIAYVAAPAADSTSASGVSAGEGSVAIGPSESLERLFRVETVAEKPTMSQLMRNRYDAIVIDDGHGGVEIVTIKGDEFRGLLEQAISAPDAIVGAVDEGRGVGATVIGFLVMFVLMSGSAFMNFFTDDKTFGTFRRTVTAPVGMGSYLAGQLLFNAFMLFVPLMGILIVLHSVFGVDIGFTYAQYGLLTGLMALFATALGFFFAATIENPDDAMAVSSTVIIVTSLLGGTFFAFEHDDAFMQWLTRLLPQKSIMAIAEGLEQSVSRAELFAPLLHIVAVSAVLCGIGWALCAGRFRRGAY